MKNISRFLGILISILIIISSLLTTSPVLANTSPTGGAVAKPGGFIIKLPWTSGESVSVQQGYGSNLHQNTQDPSRSNDYYAIDFGFAQNKPVLAIAGGTVIFAGWTSGGWSTYGQSVCIAHNYGGQLYQSFYAHLSQVDVNVGDTVAQSQRIGIVGGSGNGVQNYWATHLHFVLYQGASCPVGKGPYGGRAVVPEPFSGKQDYSDIRAGQILTASSTPSSTTTPPTTTPVQSSLQLVTTLALSPQNPLVGQTVVGSFTVRNTGGQSITIQKLIVAVRGPNASGINDDTKVTDFRFDENVTLGPGQTYTYSQERSFFEAGTYLAFATYQDAQGVWRGPFSGTTPMSFTVTRLSAPIRTNTPSITSVQITNPGRDAHITVNGSGFGDAPVNMPFSGDLQYFVFYMRSTDGTREWSAGYDGGPGKITWVTLKYTSWSDTQIIIEGFAGDYGVNNTLANGDPFGVAFRSCNIGPRSEWSGIVGAVSVQSSLQLVTTLALSPQNPPITGEGFKTKIPVTSTLTTGLFVTPSPVSAPIPEILLTPESPQPSLMLSATENSLPQATKISEQTAAAKFYWVYILAFIGLDVLLLTIFVNILPKRR